MECYLIVNRIDQWTGGGGRHGRGTKGEIFNNLIEDFPWSAGTFAVIRPIAERLYFVMRRIYRKDGSQELSITITVS